jgi:hypothetical protein
MAKDQRRMVKARSVALDERVPNPRPWSSMTHGGVMFPGPDRAIAPLCNPNV